LKRANNSSSQVKKTGNSYKVFKAQSSREFLGQEDPIRVAGL
jgi:hypothetical protein